MSETPPELGATNVRLTFRTFKPFVRKLLGIAQAHDLRLGRRLSLGAALNLIIGAYDDSREQHINQAKKRLKKKGAKR